MSQTDRKQYAFSVDFEERAAFNQAVKANGLSAMTEVQRMVDDFLRDRSQYNEILESSGRNPEQGFQTKMVKINAHLDGASLRRLTVTCLYANVCVSNILRSMIVAYPHKRARFSESNGNAEPAPP